MIDFLLSAYSLESGCVQFPISCLSEQDAFDFCESYFRRAFCSSLMLFRYYERQGERVLAPIFTLGL